MTADWVTWALQLLLGVLLARVWIQLDKNTDAISAMREHLPTFYLPKREFEYFRTDTDKSLHDMRNDVHVSDRQLAEVRAQVDGILSK